jgi:uncharacterized protein (TIGR02268 family)
VPSCVFVALALLFWSTRVLAAPSSSNGEVEGIVRMEVGPEGQGTRPIRIAPGISTTFLFDTDIQQEQLELESRDRFARVSTGSTVVVIVPPSDIRKGETLKLSIPFKEPGARLPQRLTLTLVAQPDAVDRQVELFRRTRSAESYRQEAEQLRSELERLKQERLPSPGGGREVDGLRGILVRMTSLSDLRSQRMMQGSMSCKEPCPLTVENGTLYVLGGRRAVVLPLVLRSEKPWHVGRAVLLNAKGREWESLPPAQSAPFTKNASANLVLEFPMEFEQEGPFMLKLWDAEGNQTLQFRKIEF